MTTAERKLLVKQDFNDARDAGRKSFMKKYQARHKKLNSCSYAFAGVGWTNETFTPVDDISASTMINVFYASDIEGDLVEILDHYGVVFDSSKCTNCNGFFGYSAFTRVGVVDCSKSSGAVSSIYIYASKLKTIDKWILKSDGSQTINKCFTGCAELENIGIEGVIGKNGMDVSPCTKLTVTSLLNIFRVHADKSADTSGTSWVCTIGPENLAKLSDEQKAIITNKGWTLL